MTEPETRTMDANPGREPRTRTCYVEGRGGWTDAEILGDGPGEDDTKFRVGPGKGRSRGARRPFVFYSEDCFSPPLYVVWGTSFDDAYSEVTESAEILGRIIGDPVNWNDPSEANDYAERRETGDGLAFADGLEFDVENLQGFEPAGFDADPPAILGLSEIDLRGGYDPVRARRAVRDLSPILGAVDELRTAIERRMSRLFLETRARRAARIRRNEREAEWTPAKQDAEWRARRAEDAHDRELLDLLHSLRHAAEKFLDGARLRAAPDPTQP